MYDVQRYSHDRHDSCTSLVPSSREDVIAIVSATTATTPTTKMAAMITVPITAKFRILIIVHRNKIIKIKIIPNYLQI